MKRITFITLLFSVLPSIICYGTTTAFTFGDGSGSTGGSAGYFDGWRFIPENDITVIEGGFWDYTDGGQPDPFWGTPNFSFVIVDAEDGGTLYSQTLTYADTVLDGPHLGGGRFRYSLLDESVDLQEGHEYLVATFARPSIICYPSDGINGVPGIQIIDNQSNVDTSIPGWTYQPWAGANFKFIVAPEATTVCLLSFGSLLLRVRCKVRRGT